MFDFMKNRRAGTAEIDEATPLADVRYVVLDTELTGLDERKDSIVSIGAVRMAGGKIFLGDTFYRLVNPANGLTAHSIVIHEITPSEVAAEPDIGSVLREFLDYCGRDILVGHFSAIDLAFLRREVKQALGKRVQNPVIDTYSVYEWLRKRLSHKKCFDYRVADCRLYDIVTCFGIPVEGAHNALKDAFATAQLFQRFLPFLREAGAQSIGDLLRIGIPFEGGDCYGQTGEIGNF
jgi:DNA polymerase III subunit epsilon